MRRYYVGIDNGTTGSIGLITEDKDTGFYDVKYIMTPSFSQLSYTKRSQIISRIDHDELKRFLESNIPETERSRSRIILERPLVNPQLFKASINAVRSLESTLIILEQLNLPYSYIDSKEWQGALLPKGSKGKELKTSSKEIGIRLFPQFKKEITSHGDADGLMIAEYCRRTS